MSKAGAPRPATLEGLFPMTDQKHPFSVGARVKRVRNFTHWAPEGFETTITEAYFTNALNSDERAEVGYVDKHGESVRGCPADMWALVTQPATDNASYPAFSLDSTYEPGAIVRHLGKTWKFTPLIPVPLDATAHKLSLAIYGLDFAPGGADSSEVPMWTDITDGDEAPKSKLETQLDMMRSDLIAGGLDAKEVENAVNAAREMHAKLSAEGWP